VIVTIVAAASRGRKDGPGSLHRVRSGTNSVQQAKTTALDTHSNGNAGLRKCVYLCGSLNRNRYRVNVKLNVQINHSRKQI